MREKLGEREIIEGVGNLGLGEGRLLEKLGKKRKRESNA